jgi:hypothetical protein
MSIITLKKQITPSEFRALTGWSVYKMSRVSDIPLQSLYNYLKSPDDPRYREPKPFINRFFAVLYQLYQSELATD